MAADDPQDKNAAALAVARARPPLERRTAFSGSFEPREEDHLQSLVDVLENLPAAKPTAASLRVQLATPALLAAKALYDLCAAVWDMVNHGLSIKQVGLGFLSLMFIMVGVWAWATLKKAHVDALAKTDPHHQRALARAKVQLADIKASREASSQGGPAASALSPPQPSAAAIVQDDLPEPITPEGERLFADITVRELLGFFRDHLEVQASKLADAYVGKWLTVEGSIEEVSSTMGGWSTVTVSIDDAYAQLDFRPEHLSRLSALRRNSKIKVCGKLAFALAYTFRLKNCELLEAASERGPETGG